MPHWSLLEFGRAAHTPFGWPPVLCSRALESRPPFSHCISGCPMPTPWRPPPGSAVLSGLAVKGYLICLLKVLYNVFGQTLMRQFTVHQVLTVTGIVAILAGSILALKQDELKRRLAYSTVAQIGYIVLGFGFVNVRGLGGSLFYLASHALIKSTLFLAAGALISATGKNTSVNWRVWAVNCPLRWPPLQRPAWGVSGHSAFSGFVGKWHLLLGSLDAHNAAAAIVIIVGSVLCATYLFPFCASPISSRPPRRSDWHDSPGLAQKPPLFSGRCHHYLRYPTGTAVESSAARRGGFTVTALRARGD